MVIVSPYPASRSGQAVSRLSSPHAGLVPGAGAFGVQLRLCNAPFQISSNVALGGAIGPAAQTACSSPRPRLSV